MDTKVLLSDALHNKKQSGLRYWNMIVLDIINQFQSKSDFEERNKKKI